MSKILVTGGTGFIGHHLVEYLLKNTDEEIVVLDRLDTSGNLNRLLHIENWESLKNRVKFVWHDLKADMNTNEILTRHIGKVNTIMHVAAGSHVDRSIDFPMEFVMDNVVGTCNILNYARKCDNLKNMIYFSTDEIFGPAPEGVNYKEWDRYNSGNPYSASKAGGEELCLAFHNTYKLPIMISHCMNVFGERQHPEKFIPKCIKKIKNGETIHIHSNSEKTKAGSRYYIHARNVCSAVNFIMKNGKFGDKYNIVGEKEVDNYELASIIAKIMGKPLKYEFADFHSSRPGHDLRYALDGSKMSNMGWKLENNFEESLETVVKWTLNQPAWLGE